jgi:hypothetical protein
LFCDLIGAYITATACLENFDYLAPAKKGSEFDLKGMEGEEVELGVEETGAWVRREEFKSEPEVMVDAGDGGTVGRTPHAGGASIDTGSLTLDDLRDTAFRGFFGTVPPWAPAAFFLFLVSEMALTVEAPCEVDQETVLRCVGVGRYRMR